MDAKTIAEYALKSVLKSYYIKGTELEPYQTGRRFDVYGIKRPEREVRVLEVKSCREDFLSDKKWQEYLPYCTHFAFIAPEGVIKPEELPRGIGLIEVCFIGHKLKHNYKVRCGRLQQRLGDHEYIKILEALALRGFNQSKGGCI